MSLSFNYRHLYYFWVVAEEGGIVRGAARLGVAVQTVSAQVRELERALGHTLLRPSGRGVVLTEAGRAAAEQAGQIFQLGQALPAQVKSAAASPARTLAVGLSEDLPKLVVHRLLAPVLGEPGLRLLCHESGFGALMSELALHRLDLVLADRPAPASGATPRLGCHPLGASSFAWYAAPSLWQAAAADFPRGLGAVPVLLPSAQSAVRAALEGWFERQGFAPQVAGEFDDSALLKTFGASGLGVFAAAELTHEELLARYGVRRVGPCEGVEQRYFMIGKPRRLMQPLVQRLLGG